MFTIYYLNGFGKKGLPENDMQYKKGAISDSFYIDLLETYNHKDFRLYDISSPA